MSFATPICLLGLALLPVIRWWHRGGAHRRALPVPRLGLWQGAAANRNAVGERRPPDPAWRRRALLAALLFAALAGPQWPLQRPRITLWVDDSLSMLTREAKGTRLAEGMAQARSLLAAAAPAEVEVRALGDPWHRLGEPSETTGAALVAGAGRKPPAAPPAALLRRDRLHWLVTDGADATLLEWPAGARPDHIVQVGSATRNVGLARLAARRNLSDPDRIDLLLKVSNGGNAIETRELVFSTEAGEAARSTHRLDPGASAFVTATVALAAQARAALQPGDALAEDDQIVLDLAPLRRRRVAADAACPAALLAAIGAHPALTLAPANASDVDAWLDCGTPGPARSVATLRVLADRLPARPAAALQWSAAVAEPDRIRLDAERLRLSARLQARTADAVLLAAGDAPLIVSRAGGASTLLETSLDFAAMSNTPASPPGAEIPLLVNLMFERLLGGRLLDAVAVTDRGPAAGRIAPSPGVVAQAQARGPVESRVAGDAARPLLVAALLVLLWEIVALGRQAYRLRDDAQARSG